MKPRWLLDLALVGLMLPLAACSPRLNWRAIQMPQSPLTAQFPCKPDHFSRTVPLAGQAMQVGVSSCAAAGQTFAITAVDMKATERAAPGLDALRAAAQVNFAGRIEEAAPRAVRGAAPHPGAQQFSARVPQPGSGAELQVRIVLFAQGSWAYQATVLGPALEQEAVDGFFDGLKLNP